MSVHKVALIDKTEHRVVPPDDLARYAAALQVQVDRDLAPQWGVQADISVLAAGKAIPKGTRLVKIVDDLPGNQGGVHLDVHGHPYAEAVNGDQLSIAISHELLEMLVDPQGTRFRQAIDCDPYSGGQRVHYLLEVCDPCEITSYEINGVQVSDFIFPAFYDPYAEGPFDQCRTLAAPLPRPVPYGCYISWIDPLDPPDPPDRRTWHQQRPDGTFVIVAATPGANPRDDRDALLAQANLHNIPAIYQEWA
jgi:hypothetical protein